MLRGSGTNEKIEANSERECAFYADYLLNQVRGASIRNLRGRTQAERLEKLNEEVDLLIKKNRAPKNFVTQMRLAFKATQLSINSFRWIELENERLCNWVWCYLKSNTNSANDNHDTADISPENVNIQALSGDAFHIDRDNVQDRFNDILQAFHNGEADYQQQHDIAEHLKNKWEDVSQDKTVINWLDNKNPNQWIWAWSYLQNLTKRPLEQAWTPKTDLDKKSAVIATIDLSSNLDRKALVIDKMKKAWSQKKFREKSNGKKPYSISMTLNTKQKLNALAEENNMKINEMIERLVQNEYKKCGIND